MNPIDGIPEYDDGGPPSLDDFRRIAALARRAEQVEAGQGLNADYGEGGLIFAPAAETELWARLTAAGTGTYLGKYSWKQAQSDGAGGVVDAPGGMVGAFDGSTGPPAVEVMLGSGLTVGASTGQVVKMWLAESGDHYWFREAPPAGLTTKDDATATVTVSPTATLILEAKAKGGFALSNPSTNTAKYTPPQQYVCALYRRAVTLQSIANSTLTAVSWDTKSIDTGGIASFGAVPLTTLTCPGITGWPNPSDLPCLVSAQVTFAANGTGTRYAEILLSGGAPLAAQSVPACATGPTVLNLSFLAPFTFGTGGAQVLINVWQDSGGALNVGTLSGTAFGTGNLDTRISLAPHQLVASS